ncbi:MAG: ABC transporter ATP-binding protein [Thermomicrobiales bacterium]|nr:ABC transporter ATP-binding protein [Thermomicrobiales bacterium]
MRSTVDSSNRPYSIELRRVSKQFGDVVAVDDISLQVTPGEFLTLLGPSGCGKTTTLRMIGGFELPTSGELLIHGEEMGSRPPYRRPVNTVFQNYALFPHLNVGQNIGYGLEMSKVPKDERKRRVSEALEMVRLPHVEKRKPSELSGGQQQRVALARALINRPEVLLLDEPLGALDLKLRKAMQFELKRLNHEVGATFVYVTHDQEEALTVSDRIAVMNAGKILQIGTPAEIYERPRDRFVADFVGQTNFLEGSIAGVDHGLATVEIEGLGTIRARMSDASPVNGPVTVAVRPERVFLTTDAPGAGDAWNRVGGSVEQETYLGTHSQLMLRLPGGQMVVVYRQNRSLGEAGARVGEVVTAVFDPESATILRT